MKTLRLILVMILFLGLGFLLDFLLDNVVPGDAVPYYWLSLLGQLILGALFLLLIYLSLHREWLTRQGSILYIIVGALILIWTPIAVIFMQYFSEWSLPGFTPRSFFAFSGLFVLITGVFARLPKPKKLKK